MALPQGDLGLLESDVARRLLSSTVPARLAYTAKDGTPRVMPIWFHWTGDELVMCTFVPSPKIAAIRQNPVVAVTIDTEGFPSESLLVRGRASVTEVEGAAPEDVAAARRYLGEEAAAAYIPQVNQAGARMASIAVRPSWVGVLDFQTRFPNALPERLRS
jgi:nitroimidazol reductase NimA-like FMN-containing flavoprotein (pyridoxamine 5'-phosphate oxidase superfamily)